MDKKTTLEMIAAISNANGTSGFEDEVVAAIRPYAEGLGEITEDRMRNLYICLLYTSPLASLFAYSFWNV